MSKAILLASVSEMPELPSHLKPIRRGLYLNSSTLFPQLLLAVFLIIFSFPSLTMGQIDARNEKPAEFNTPYLIEFEGPIDGKLSKHFYRKLAIAKSAGADLIMLEIESPGGLKSESLRIAESLRDVDWAYTVAYIPKRAISGAALVSLGCDEIIVGQNARFGDIGEIYWDPESFAYRLVTEKMNSELVPQARSLAKSKGRPPELAEAMIDKDMQVFRRPLGDGWEYQNVRINEQAPGGDWELIDESKEGRFLTLEGPRMVEIGLANAFSDDREEIAAHYGIDLAETRVLGYTNSDYVADLLCSPWLTGLLIVIGLLAFYLELSAPGIGVGAIVAVFCAVLFFWSRFLGGTAGWLEAILFMAGIAFLAMELFVIPGWGVSGFAGLVLMVASIFMAGQDFVLPSNERQWAEFVTTALVILCSGCVVLIGAAFITKKIGTIPVFNRLVLQPEPDKSIATTGQKDESGKPIPTTHPLVSVGDWGKTESLLRPAGRAVFSGRSIDVISDGAFIEPDAQVKVVDIQGNRIVVVEVESDIRETAVRP